MGGQQIAQVGGLQAADPAGVAAVQLVLHLGAGDFDFLAVHHDDAVAVVHVGSEFGLVLAAQAVGELAGQTAQNQTLGINDKPVVFDVLRSGAEGLHELDSIVRTAKRAVGRNIIAAARRAHGKEFQ